MKLLVMYNYEPSKGHLDRLRQISGVPVIAPVDEAEAIKHCDEAIAFLGHRYLRQCLAQNPRNLKWIQLLGGGFDHLGLDLAKLPYIITRTTFASEMIAWHAFTLMLAVVRGLNCNGERLLPFPKKGAIIGFGEIGRRLGQRLMANQIEVHGVNRSGSGGDDCHFTYKTGDKNWLTMLEDMDACFLCMPLSKDTRGFFSEDCFNRLKSTAVLVVVGRAGTVDIESMIRHLHKIGGVAFDVPDSPKIKDDKVLMTPWIAGRYPERAEQNERFIEIQVKCFIENNSLMNVVSF